MRALFLSDVHVSPARPEAVAALVDLLEAAIGRLDALFVLGDLFDQWLGDDDVTPPHPEVEAGLRAVANSGTHISAHHGNHDFLLGISFAERTGCEVVSGHQVVELDGVKTVLLHGDVLCTDDVEYQEYRKYTRTQENQAAFLALPLAERQAHALALSQSSAELKRLRSDEIMDVNPDAVRKLLVDSGAHQMVHGHTHRPKVHTHLVDNQPARRIVLGDWYESPGEVALQERGALKLLTASMAQKRLTKN